MKGTIELESTPNVGSKATFTVPLKVSSGCGNPGFDFTASSPPHPGFRLSTRISKAQAPAWTQSLAHRSMSQDLLNQEISNTVKNYPPFPPAQPERSLPQGTITAVSSLPLTLSPEERSKTHVLVVEDNAVNQTIALRTIRKLGFPVTAVWNGRDALSYLLAPSASQPRPAIILMDVQMPVMDGYEATRTLRSGSEYAGENAPLREIPVIAMTASAIQGDREKCHEAGMDDYLAKPVEKARLEQMLVKWAGRRRAEA